MDFRTYLNSLLDTLGYIPDTDEYEYQELSKLFPRNGDGVGILLDVLEERKNNDEWSWTLNRFLETKIEDGSIRQEKRGEIAEKMIGFAKDASLRESLRSMALRIFFLTEKDVAKKKDCISFFLTNGAIQYELVESLVFHAFDSIADFEDEFPKLLLTALNTPRGNRLGLTWRSELFLCLAKSKHLEWFLTEITKESSSNALHQFLEMGDNSANAFFENLPRDSKTKKSVVTFLKHILTTPAKDEGHYPFFIDYLSHHIQEFQTPALKYAVESWVSVVELLKPLLDKIPWDAHKFIAPYIQTGEVKKLYKILGIENAYLFWIRNQIEVSDRADKDALLVEFDQIPGFRERLEVWRKERKKQDRAIARKKKQEIEWLKKEIISCIEWVEETHIHPRLIELYSSHKELFNEEQKEVVKTYLERFFSWKLFPLDQITITKQVNENGAKSFHGGVWYMSGFFMLALRIAKDEFLFDFSQTEAHKSLVRSIPLVYFDRDDAKYLFETIGELTNKDVQEILSVYDGSRKDDLVSFWGGQNFFPMVEKFLSDFVREENKPTFRKVLKYWIENKNDDLSYGPRKAMEYLLKEGVIDRSEDIPYLKKIFDERVLEVQDSPSMYISDQWNPVVAANTALIRLWDDEAIRWRFASLQVKISMRDPFEGALDMYARSISQLESEITHGGEFIWVLKEINIVKYKDEFLELIGHWLSLLDENKGEYGMFANYILSWVFESFKKLSFESFSPLRNEIEDIIDSHEWFSRQRGNWYFRGLKNHFIRWLQADFLWWISTEETRTLTSIASVSTHETADKQAEQLAKINFLKNELHTKEKELEELKKRHTSYEEMMDRLNYVVLIEGKTWVEHLQNAWNQLRPREKMPFIIQNGYDADNIKKIMIDSDALWNKITIGILDFDSKWISRWHGTHVIDDNRKFARQSTSVVIWECMHRSFVDQIKKEERHLLLLPCTRLLHELTHNSVQDAYFDGIWWDSMRDFCIAVEEMYLGIHPEIDNEFFENYKFKTENKKKAAKTKREFLGRIKAFVEKIDGFNPNDLYVNFSPLFTKVLEIIDNYKKRS